MISLQKIGDSAVKFVFTDSDHYLYGNGEIEVPVNSLLLVIDESDMVTFKKLSGDPFLSFRADNSNLGTKAAIEQFYKDNMVGSTGGGSESGITSGEVQTMIDESISGKADTSDVTAVANDVSTLSGQVATKVATSDFNTYSAATDSRLAEDEEVTAAALNDLDENKQDALVYYMEDTENETANINIQTDDGLGNTGEFWLNVGGGTNDFGAFSQYDDGEGNVTKSSTQINISSYELIISSDSNDGEDYNTIEVTPTYVTINGEAVATRPYVNDAIDAATSGKADTSAVTAVANDVTVLSGAVDDAKAYYIDFTTLATVGIHDEDWNGIVAAIDDHRPIYAGYPRTDGGIIYYGVECMNKNSGNTEIVLTASDDNQHYFYTFVKNGSNDYSYTVDTKPYVTDAEKTAWNAKVDTSAIITAITSGSTDAQVPSAKAVYDAIQAGGGGGVTVDPTLDSGSNNPVANSAITNAINAKLQDIELSNQSWVGPGVTGLKASTNGSSFTVKAFAGTINNKSILTGSNYANVNMFSLVETSAITSAMTSSSTDAQVPSAKAVYDTLGGLRLQRITQANYDQLVNDGMVDPDTLYIIDNAINA